MEKCASPMSPVGYSNKLKERLSAESGQSVTDRRQLKLEVAV